MTFQIRPLNITDIPQIHNIERRSFSEPWTKPMFYSELQSHGHNYSLVIEESSSKTIVGYCFFWIFEEDEVHINNIAIHPSYRKQGLGSKLMQEATRMGIERGAKSVTLEVRESNQGALEFYMRQGFHFVGKRIGYYTNPKEDALILRRKN